MERNFSVITETNDSTIRSPFRFTAKKAIILAQNMDRLTDTKFHHAIEVGTDNDLIEFDPIKVDEDGIPDKDGERDVPTTSDRVKLILRGAGK